MRSRRWALAGAALVAVLVAGCTADDPDPAPTAGPGQTGLPGATGPARVPAEPVPDCAEVLSLIPADVASDVGADPGAATPEPAQSADAEGYLTTCVITGRSAVDPRLRIFLQLRIERPRVDPYKLTPLARWFDDNAKAFVGVNCSPAAPWAGQENGLRCSTENSTNVTLYLAGKAKGALVGLQTNVSPLQGQAGVTADAVRAAATTSGERIMTAVAASL